MEKLLNKLIERGWYPFCDNNVKEIRIYSDMDIECIYGKRKSDFYYTSYRKLTSKESGLWQFCVENNLVNKYADLGPDEEEAYIGKRKNGLDAIDINGDYIRLDDDYDEYHQDTDYKYWLIECALCDEDKLEQFILDNIKVE